MTQNVVTYTVVVDTDNSSGQLLPYLTTNLQFEVGRRQNALLVPNAALRWQPQSEQVAPEFRQEVSGTTVPPAEGTKRHDSGLVWVVENGFVRPVAVRLGLSDGLQTEVTGGALGEGQPVVVGEVLPADASGTTSPFAPQPFGGKVR